MPSMGTSPATRADSDVADAAELRRADHHVVDAPVEVEAWRPRTDSSFDAGVSGLAVVAGGEPRVAEHHAGHRDRGLPGQHADLVAVRLGVEVAAQHRRERAGPVLAHEPADLGDLVLADRAVVVAPAEVRAVHLDRTARPVDLGEDAEPFLAFLVVARVAGDAREQRGPRARVIGQRDTTAFPDRTPSRSRLGAKTASVVAERGGELAGLVARRRRPTLPAAPGCRRRRRAGSP